MRLDLQNQAYSASSEYFGSRRCLLYSKFKSATVYLYYHKYSTSARLMFVPVSIALALVLPFITAQTPTFQFSQASPLYSRGSSTNVVQFSGGLEYIAVVSGGSANEPVEIYQIIDGAYSLREKIYCDCSSCSSSGHEIFLWSDGSKMGLLCSDSLFRLFKIGKHNITLLQSFSWNGLTSPGYNRVISSYLSEVMVISSQSELSVYTWNNVTQLYEEWQTYSHPTSHTASTAISLDRQILMQGSGLSDSANQIYIYQRNHSGIFQPVGKTFQLYSPPFTQATVNGIYIGQEEANCYVLVSVTITLDRSPEATYLRVYAYSNQQLSLLQDLGSYTTKPTIFMTRNAQYLAYGVGNSLYAFYLKNSSLRYEPLLMDYPLGSSPNSIFVDEDGSSIGIGLSSKSGINNQRLIILVNCSVANCLTCSWKGFCKACIIGYTLFAGKCECHPLSTLWNGKCIDCNVTKCLSCSAPLYCSSCSDGYTANQGRCQCPAGSTISLDSRCVLCSVRGCLRCDEKEICSLFQLASELPQNNLNSKSALSLEVILKFMLILMVILTLGGLIMCWRIKGLQKLFQREQNHDASCLNARTRPTFETARERRKRNRVQIEQRGQAYVQGDKKQIVIDVGSLSFDV